MIRKSSITNARWQNNLLTLLRVGDRVNGVKAICPIAMNSAEDAGLIMKLYERSDDFACFRHYFSFETGCCFVRLAPAAALGDSRTFLR